MTIQWGRPPLAAVISVVLILGAAISAQVRGVGEPEGPTRLEPGQPITRNLAGHETQVYTVNLSAGQFFEACLDRLGMVVDIKVYAPSGKQVAQGDGVWENNECDMVSHLATEDGLHRIEVRLFFPNARGGSYRLRLVALRAPTEADRHRVLGNRFFAAAHRRRARWNQESSQAIAEFEEAIKHWQAAGDRVREAMCYASIATVYRSLGELPKSTEFFERALAIFRAEGKQSLELDSMTDLGYTYAKQGQILRSVTLTREALNLGRARGDLQGQCRALLILGGISIAAGNVRAGQEYNREGLPICRAVPSPFGERIALSQIADSLVYLGEPQQALDYFNQALQVVTPAFDAYAQGYIRLSLARLRLQIGDLQEALAQGQRALESFRQVGMRDGEGNTRLVLGLIYRALGDDQQSYHSLTQAFDLSAATGDLHLKALSLHHLAGLAIRLGRRAEAEKYLEQAAGAYREKRLPSSEVEALKQLGRLELLRGRPQVAVDHFREALRQSRSLELAAHETELLWILGTTYLALDDREQAAESLRQALDKARDKRLPDYEIQALGGLARLAREQGDDREAQTLLETALNLIETSRARIDSPDFRVSFFSATQSFYEAYIETLMTRHEREADGDRFAALALQAVERARARSLLELLTEARADIRQGIEPALLDREHELQQRLTAKAERLLLLGQSGKSREQAAALKAELEALTLEQRDLAAQIRVHSPRYAALQQPRTLTVPEIQRQVLDSETLLLEYALGEKRSFLFAVTRNQIRSFVLPGRREIEQLARRMLTLLEASARPPAFSRRVKLAAPRPPRVFKSMEEKERWERRLQQEYPRAALALSRILLAPAGELLDRKRLLIVNDGLLHYLPFAALPEPAAIRQPLVVNHEIVTIPSASTLAVLRQELNERRPAPKMLAVLADPVFGKEDERFGGPVKTLALGSARRAAGEISEQLFRRAEPETEIDLFIPRLPGTRREAEAILSFVPEDQRKAAFDFDASRATATSGDLGQYRYLHFATHGLLNNEHPELSGLVLSMVDRAGQRQPGILRALEIYNLRLPVELVVLSACRTALGKESGGEGVVGLTRGFFYAGARRVIASLWVVSDAATSELMRRFYGGLLGDQRLSPAAALRAAQVSMWRESKWSAPYYWAAFTLQGEW